MFQVMHGGLFSEDGVTLDDIRKIERNRQPPDSGKTCLIPQEMLFMSELMWSCKGQCDMAKTFNTIKNNLAFYFIFFPRTFEWFRITIQIYVYFF